MGNLGLKLKNLSQKEKILKSVFFLFVGSRQIDQTNRSLFPMVLCILFFSFTITLSTIAPVYNSITFMTPKLMLSRVQTNVAPDICLLVLQWENQF